MAYGFTYTLPTVTTESNFPVILKTADFPATAIDASANSFATGGGEMMAYTDSTKTTQLPLEIVTFVSSATVPDAEVWVKVTSLVTGGTIYLEKDDTQTVQPAVTDATGGRNAVWTDYWRVFHLVEAFNGTAGGYIDSSGNGNASGVSMSANVAGKWGSQVAEGDGTTVDRIETNYLINGTDFKGMSSWIYYKDIDWNLWGTTDNVDRRSWHGTDNIGNYSIGIGNATDSATSHSFVVNTWYKERSTFDGSTARYYVDGVEKLNFAATFSGSNARSLRILQRNASSPNGLFARQGLVTLPKNTLSANWEATEFSNQNASTAWGTVGTWAVTGAAAITSVGGDDVVLDAEQNVSFVTSGFSGEISTVQLVSGTSITTINPVSINSTSGTGDFDLPDITGYVVDTVGCPLTTANNVVVARLTDA